MIRTNLALLSFLGIFLASTVSGAEVQKQEKIEPAKEKFFVYGGNCSRSISLRGTYENAREACWTAEKLRSNDKMKWVSVRTGAHQQDYFGSNATQYKVYRSGCRLGWSLAATFDKADKAAELAEKLKKDGTAVEIVLHYAPK